MMPDPPRPAPPAGTARVVVSGTNQGHVWNNIFYLQLAGTGITSTDLDSLASTISTAWATAIPVHLTNTCVMTSVSIVFIPSPGTEVVGQWSGSHAGSTSGEDIHDAGASLVVSWKTGAYYRGGHPRWYLAGVRTSTVTLGSDINATVAASLAGDLAIMRGSINSATTTHISSCTMGTVSFQSGKAWRTPPIFRAFGSVSVRSKLGTQRRRILG